MDLGAMTTEQKLAFERFCNVSKHSNEPVPCGMFARCVSHGCCVVRAIQTSGILAQGVFVDLRAAGL